jgi:hypothetical protein
MSKGTNKKYPFRIDLYWPGVTDLDRANDAYDWIIENVGACFFDVIEIYPSNFAVRFKDERHALMFKLACQ